MTGVGGEVGEITLTEISRVLAEHGFVGIHAQQATEALAARIAADRAERRAEVEAEALAKAWDEGFERGAESQGAPLGKRQRLRLVHNPYRSQS